MSDIVDRVRWCAGPYGFKEPRLARITGEPWVCASDGYRAMFLCGSAFLPPLTRFAQDSINAIQKAEAARFTLVRWDELSSWLGDADPYSPSEDKEDEATYALGRIHGVLVNRRLLAELASLRSGTAFSVATRKRTDPILIRSYGTKAFIFVVMPISEKRFRESGGITRGLPELVKRSALRRSA